MNGILSEFRTTEVNYDLRITIKNNERNLDKQEKSEVPILCLTEMIMMILMIKKILMIMNIQELSWKK